MSEKKDFDVKKTEFEDIFKVCPECGYKDGFHSMFERAEMGNKLEWYFICPDCSSVFDIGLSVEK